MACQEALLENFNLFQKTNGEIRQKLEQKAKNPLENKYTRQTQKRKRKKYLIKKFQVSFRRFIVKMVVKYIFVRFIYKKIFYDPKKPLW